MWTLRSYLSRQGMYGATGMDRFMVVGLHQLTLMLLVANLANRNDVKMAETLANGYSTEGTQ